MDLQVLASNVKRLRKGNPHLATQGALAEAADVSRRIISDIERAHKKPDMAVMVRIADALDVRRVLSLFQKPRELPTACFRMSKTEVTRQKYAIQNLQADVAVWLDDFAYLEKVLGAKQEFRLQPVRQKFAKRKLDADAPRRAAEMCRKVLNLKLDKPIDNIFTLLTKIGVKVYPAHTHADNFFGFAVADADGGPAVVVNVSPDISVERWIFSAAHELGHLILHSATGGNGADKESLADQFAGHFLVPSALLQREWEKTNNEDPIDRIIKVKRVCKVSYRTILHRLANEGMAGDFISCASASEYDKGEMYKFVLREFTSCYEQECGEQLGNKSEPQPLVANEIFAPDQLDAYQGRLRKLVVRAIDADKLGITRGAEMLDINLYEMRDVLQLKNPVS